MVVCKTHLERSTHCRVQGKIFIVEYCPLTLIVQGAALTIVCYKFCTSNQENEMCYMQRELKNIQKCTQFQGYVTFPALIGWLPPRTRIVTNIQPKKILLL